MKEKKLKRHHASTEQKALGACFRSLPTLQAGLPADKRQQLLDGATSMLARKSVTLGNLEAYLGLAIWCVPVLPPYTKVHVTWGTSKA